MTSVSALDPTPMVSDPSGLPARDYDVHGIVGIRLTGAGPSEISAVHRQLGVAPGAPQRPPDVTIRFVDRLEPAEPLYYLSGDTAFNDDAFLLTSGRSRRPVMALPFGSIGERSELVVARGTAPVPLLVPIVLLTALGKGYLPVHASAFVHDGTGTLIAGGASGGKTGTLLAFMDEGASFVGDDWILLAGDGETMWGLEAPIQVKEAYLQALPRYRERLDRRTRRRLAVMGALTSAEGWLPRWASGGASLPARGRARIRASLEARLVATAGATRLFGAASLRGSAPLHVACLARSKSTPGVAVQAATTEELVEALAPLLEHEWADLDRRYGLFRSAFPGRRNPLLEGRGARTREGLTRALAGKRTLTISYPSPAPVKDVYRTLAPWLVDRQRGDPEYRKEERP